MSAFLTWELIRRTDSRLIKKSAGTFSSDPLNLTGLHNYSSSSAQSKALGLRAAPSKDKKASRTTRFVLTSKIPANANKPKTSLKSVWMGAGKKRAAKIANIVTLGAAKPGATSSLYREDLHQAVLSRFSTLLKAEKRKIAKSTISAQVKKVAK